MQDQVETRAGLNGAGAGYGQMPLLDAETMPVPAPMGRAGVAGSAAMGRRSRSRSWSTRSNAEALRRRVTETTESLDCRSPSVRRCRRDTLRTPIRDAMGWSRPRDAPKAPAGGRVAPRRASGSPRRLPTTAMVRARLLRAVDRQIDKVDARLRKKGAVVEEKDSRILGNLAKTLSALMQIGEGGTTSKDAEPPNRGERRGKTGSNELSVGTRRRGILTQPLGCRWTAERTSASVSTSDGASSTPRRPDAARRRLADLADARRARRREDPRRGRVRARPGAGDPAFRGTTRSSRSRWSARPMPTCAR